MRTPSARGGAPAALGAVGGPHELPMNLGADHAWRRVPALVAALALTQAEQRRQQRAAGVNVCTTCINPAIYTVYIFMYQ